MRYLLLALVAATACTVSAQTAVNKSAAPLAARAQQASPNPAPATPTEAIWEKEPDSFVGVKFNEPFNVTPCPTKILIQHPKTEMLDRVAMKSLQGVCLDTTDRRYKHRQPEHDIFKLENLPSLGIWYKLNVHTKNGVVSEITMDLEQSDFGVLLTAFKDRYGTPSSIESTQVKTNAGAEFKAARVIWKGKKLSIQMYERMGKIDESYVVISDNAIKEAEVVAQRASRAAEAQKF